MVSWFPDYCVVHSDDVSDLSENEVLVVACLLLDANRAIVNLIFDDLYWSTFSETSDPGYVTRAWRFGAARLIFDGSTSSVRIPKSYSD